MIHSQCQGCKQVSADGGCCVGVCAAVRSHLRGEGIRLFPWAVQPVLAAPDRELNMSEPAELFLMRSIAGRSPEGKPPLKLSS